MIDLDEHDVLDVPEAARLLRVGRDAIYAMCARQALPHQKVGRSLRFSRAALMQWLATCGSQGARKG